MLRKRTKNESFIAKQPITKKKERPAYQRVEVDLDGTEALQAVCESKQISCKCTSGAQSVEEMKALPPKKRGQGG